jgi:rhodanese-related sulfurtransferase
MDVFNTAGNVADNIVSGLGEFIKPEEFDELFANRESNNYIFVDTRAGQAPLEIAKRYPDYWINMPLETFSDNIDKIPQDKNIAFICNSGTRAYECLLKFKHSGRHAVNSSGGMQAMKKRGKKY